MEDQDKAADEHDDAVEKVETEKVHAETAEARIKRHNDQIKVLTDKLLEDVKAIPPTPIEMAFTDPNGHAQRETERMAAIQALHRQYAKDAQALVATHRAETAPAA